MRLEEIFKHSEIQSLIFAYFQDYLVALQRKNEAHNVFDLVLVLLGTVCLPF